jgi:hypothetical protein
MNTTGTTSSPVAETRQHQAERTSYLPPTSDIRRLADTIIRELIEMSEKEKISLSEIFAVLDNLNIEKLDRYRHPVTEKLMAILNDNEALSNGWNEALTMVELDLRHRIITENSKTFIGRVINLLNP